MDFVTPAKPRTRLWLAALLPMLATALTFTPGLFDMPDDEPPVWMLLLPFSGPIVALIVNWRWPAATNRDRTALAALPQIFIVPLMVWLTLRLEVERGDLRMDSSEGAMAFGGGMTLGVIAGILLLWLVGFAGRLGAWLGRR